MLKMSRLPGRSVKSFGCSFQRHQLWMSHEYLLYREISGYREEVKRFYYRDIQAIVCGSTRSWRVFNWLCGVIALFGLVWIFYTLFLGGTRLPLFFPIFFLGVSAPLLLGNLWLGPTCKTTLYTATSEAPLYSLGRRRSARKAIDLVMPFIEAAQSESTEGPANATTPPDAPVGESETPEIGA